MVERDIQDRASKIVDDYAEKRTVEAHLRVNKEMHGKGCGCRRCKESAVEDANSWIEWHSAGNPDMDQYKETIKYHIDKKGRIIQGKEDKGGPKLFDIDE